MSSADARLHSFFQREFQENFEGTARGDASTRMRIPAAVVVVTSVLALGCHAPGAQPATDGGTGGNAGPCTPANADSAGTFRFAVFGDVRPSQINDTTNYPQAIVAGVFNQIVAHDAKFAVGTGDYMFASTTNDSGIQQQLGMLLAAEQPFTGPVYHAMGNHECTGATASNCPNGNETANAREYMAKLVPPGTTKPYYRIDVDTGMGTAKLVFVAANAWSQAQADWLDQQLSDVTTYTFIVRHEAPSVTETMGVTASEAIIAKHPFTMELLGHTHRYEKLDDKHVISGNGGAPLSGGHYGFLLLDQLTNGNLSVSEIDSATGAASDTFTICP
jgi:hypothetical protein